MKIIPVNNLRYVQIQNSERVGSVVQNSARAAGVKLSLENLHANLNIRFRGANILDKIAPPIFEDETLNAILQRSTGIAQINTKGAGPRSEDNAILTAWFNDEGLEQMQAGKAYPEMIKHLQEGLYDGASFEQRDKFYMMAVQRLVDSGAIDDKTFVLIDTGHSVPIAAQLMKKENREALGEVKGTFLFDSTLPETHPNVDPNNAEKMAVHKEIRNRTHQRISSQVLSFGDIINEANKNAKGSPGALFIGIDAHRDVKFDISKLPTVDELEKLGLNKVAIVQELPPLSSFSQNDAARLYNPPKTAETIQEALSCMQIACARAKKTPLGTKIDETERARIRKLLIRASDTLKPNDIDKTYPRLNAPDKKMTSKLIERRKFGYGATAGYGSDINEYLRYLEKNSSGKIKFFIEGAALLKLREAPLKLLQDSKDFILTSCNESFDRIVSGDFEAGFGK